jgi:hypothetical protein
MVLLFGYATAAFSCGRREPESPPPIVSPEVTNEACSRFLFLAIFEGLWEDGADPELIQSILKMPEDHFVLKCPICSPVSHAFSIYATSQDVPGYASRGNGFPQAIKEELKSPDRATRLKGLESLVDRYVARRFESTRMSEQERKDMQSRLIMKKKLGTSYKDRRFGEFCPSCNGATKSIK